MRRKKKKPSQLQEDVRLEEKKKRKGKKKEVVTNDFPSLCNYYKSSCCPCLLMDLKNDLARSYITYAGRKKSYSPCLLVCTYVWEECLNV